MERFELDCVQWNSTTLLDNLTRRIPDAFASACLASLRTTHDEELRELGHIADNASQLVIRGEPESDSLCTALLEIIIASSSFVQAGDTQPQLRQFFARSQLTAGDLEDNPEFPKTLPAMAFGPASDIDINRPRLLRNMDGFVAFSVPSSHSTEYKLIIKATHYARMFTAARPFRLFSVGLMVFGTLAYVAMFDHAGVVVSPYMDLQTDVGLAKFIKVTRSITHCLDDNELGLDPSVKRIDLTSYRHNGLDLSDLQAADNNSVYLVTIRTPHELVTYATAGRPYWSGVSRFGRGAQACPVKQVITIAGRPRLSQTTFILKDAWRTADEERVDRFEGELFATFVRCNKDWAVSTRYLERNSKTTRMDVGYIRTMFAVDFNPPNNAYLHRMIFDDIARPLWQFESDMELLNALMSIAKGLQWMASKGIAHRNITPDNVLLHSSNQVKGFITDFEFAALTPREEMVDYTKTIQFAALEILYAASDRMAVVYKPEHDLESLSLVLAYSILRKILILAATQDRALYDAARLKAAANFSINTLVEIIPTRERAGPLVATAEQESIGQFSMSQFPKSTRLVLNLGLRLCVINMNKSMVRAIGNKSIPAISQPTVSTTLELTPEHLLEMIGIVQND